MKRYCGRDFTEQKLVQIRGLIDEDPNRTRADLSRLWKEYIYRYHYLGHKPLPGAQLRYFVTIDQQIVENYQQSATVPVPVSVFWPI